MEINEKTALLALAHIPGLGWQSIRELRKICGSYQEIACSLRACSIPSQVFSEKFGRWSEEFRKINIANLYEKFLNQNFHIVASDEKDYPQLLHHIYNPPLLLYGKGDLRCLSQLCVAIIGTRSCSSYGEKACDEIIARLAGYPVTIVSGMAEGIDARAHENALRHGLATAAVLGTGIDVCYPSRCQHLFETIPQHGMLLSDFALNSPPNRIHFPQRNRLISGISVACVIIEAQEKSGSLITAQIALDQNRDVIAVPGNIFSPQSRGTNALIAKGAIILKDPQDIITLLSLTPATPPESSLPTPSSPSTTPQFTEVMEENIYKLLTRGTMSLEQLSHHLKTESHVLLAHLSSLEIHGYICSRGNDFEII